MIYIISASGKPLMPTERENHIKRLLNRGKARIVTKVPFTVQLKYETNEITQPLYGGTDPGRTNIGEAVVNNKGEVIYKAHVATRNKDIPKLMAERKAHRQASRRGERLRRKRRAKQNGTTTVFTKGRMLPGYEKPVMLKDIINTESRFNNRKRPENWICPTVRQLIQTHINAVKKICSILPVTGWTMEYNKFAFMKLENGEIRGVDFQNGRLKNFKDKYEYVSYLQNGKCACCNNPIEHYHHIVKRTNQGSDTPENIVGLCKGCHGKVHSGDISLKEQGLKKKYAALSVLNQAMPFIADELISIFGEDHVSFCSGYETKLIREGLAIEKDHPEDAVCIAMYGAETTGFSDNTEAYEIQQFRRHDRAIIKAQKERTYYLDGKAVCKNRHKRTDQKYDSFEEFAVKHPSDVGRLTVKKSQRSYNNLTRTMPGAMFFFAGEQHILTSQQRQGTCWHSNTLPANGANTKMCILMKHNQGLVYM